MSGKQELKNYLLDDYKDTIEYCNRMWKGGLSEFPPAIVTCAITGGNAGKEINPNLPETVEEQVESTYEAYKAGAVMVHIHAREKDNPAKMSFNPELYKEINKKVREKCPDIIVNNTNICGREIDPKAMKLGEPMTSITEAGAEIGSVDISNYFAHLKMPPRPGVSDVPWVLERGYCISQSDAMDAVNKMKKYGVKPEFECFALADFHYLNWLVNNGYVDALGGPHWIHFVFTTGSNWNAPEFMNVLKNITPRNSVLGIIAAGAQQWPVLTMALIHGLHVRVGMEDNVYIERGKKADSNAQMVEKIRRIAADIGRPLATCAQARKMLGLGEPKKWK